MNEKRYQVFISSTFKDLAEERKAIMDAVLNLDCFPSGMEMFPASDMEQFEYIKKIIEQSDYYILIVSGKYGSISDTGISYTEMEYNYAKEIGVPILTFIKKDINKLPGNKLELDDEKRNKLEEFRNKISENSLVKYWDSIGELKYNVYDSLSKSIKIKPRTGWIKGDLETDGTLLRQINNLRMENENLQQQVKKLESQNSQKLINDIDPSKLAQGDDELEIEYEVEIYYSFNDTIYENESIIFTWDELFHSIGDELLKLKSDREIQQLLNNVIYEKHYDYLNEKYDIAPAFKDETNINIKTKQLKIILLQFIHLGLIKEFSNEFYLLTENGQHRIINELLVTKTTKNL